MKTSNICKTKFLSVIAMFAESNDLFVMFNVLTLKKKINL